MRTKAAKVSVVIAHMLGVDQGAVTGPRKLVDDLGADSLDMVEIVMAIEEEFEIEINDAVAEKFTTVGDIVAHVEAVAP